MRLLSTLRARVIALAVGIAALIIVLTAVPIALLLRTSAYGDAERHATDAAQSTADYISTGNVSDSLLKAYLSRLNARGSTPVTVLLADGDVLGADLDDHVLAQVRQQHEPSLRPNDYQKSDDHDHDNPPADLGQVSNARTIDVRGGRIVQVLSQNDQGVAQVLASVTDDSVSDTVRDRYLLVGGCALALIALAWAAADLTGRRLVRPLQRTAETAVALSTGDLQARAQVEGPVEVARVAIELNALADRIGELLLQEREAAADLSHRLRTPLTAVRLAVEALPPSERTHELEAQVTQLERSLTQLIKAARRPVREGLHPRCDATAVIRDRAAFWTPLAEDQDRRVAVDLPDEPVWVRTAEEDLAAALDALLENVVAHTPDGTAFTVRLARATDGVHLDVLDEGPGIPVEALQRGRSDRGSTGLGLDIARAAAVASGGFLELLHDPAAHGVRLFLRTEPQAPLTNS
ncbi:HAMP domain-containing sensor histidine kinase [Nocardioides sp. BP30]|uniref:HAMP domain-containing sensor histidine kinase n=1 Tax=Nocardioides sp. BP30 TaxID=3036374 RepID=UPI002468B347|nr:HAMP domain-containing sensor histidine kinase [Nocardioides sp. BP30]WGL51063.1 HAMP domain-containing sensor histidine kinase [Nocardioides sp. BP30]